MTLIHKTEIKKDGITYAVIVPILHFQHSGETQWYGNDDDFIQVARMKYDKSKVFKPHKHKIRPRTIQKTQEAFIVLMGKVKASIYDDKDNLIREVILEEKSIGIFYNGGHGYKIMENGTIIIEVKPGTFTTWQEDKEYL